MFGLGIGELILIFVIFLIFFGPDKLPDLAKNLGRGLAELRRTVDEIKFDMNTTDVAPPPNRTPPQSTPQPTPSLEAPPAASSTVESGTLEPSAADPLKPSINGNES